MTFFNKNTNGGKQGNGLTLVDDHCSWKKNPSGEEQNRRTLTVLGAKVPPASTKSRRKYSNHF
jgi:hypothetical protein